ncbi:unnamed protein product [Nyctereutes procyonoides]|uniref:Mitochondrial pyruvate carrier n=1 Tax=Nyctereutes procyonoides TaxID=34880 RepID=A0A811ZRR9_NYCPR|nr:unnamed protein product [Nyctereutes procyonoides]
MGLQEGRLSGRKGTLGERRTPGTVAGGGEVWPSCQPGTGAQPLSHLAVRDHSSAGTAATGARGLQATYHWVLDKVELLVPQTAFFSPWAPITKWGLVCAGLADKARPAEQVSFIWPRYSLVIIRKTWSVSAVNLFEGLFPIWRYNQELKGKVNR